MNDITIKGDELQTIIKEALPIIFKEKFTSSYSNPIATMIEKEIEDNDGAIRLFVKETLQNILTNDKFKDLISKEIIGAILAKGLSR